MGGRGADSTANLSVTVKAEQLAKKGGEG
jgi:hypothetical protein